MEHLTTQTFKEKIFDYENNTEWKFEGDKPAMLKLSTSWCNPCKVLNPVFEELSEDYRNEIDVYTIDIEDEHEVGSAFGIQSVPSILFIPMNEQPQMAQGALPKESLDKAINEILLKK